MKDNGEDEAIHYFVMRLCCLYSDIIVLMIRVPIKCFQS